MPLLGGAGPSGRESLFESDRQRKLEARQRRENAPVSNMAGLSIDTPEPYDYQLPHTAGNDPAGGAAGSADDDDDDGDDEDLFED